MVFSIFADMCEHYHSQFQNIFNTLRRNLAPFRYYSLYSPQPKATTNMLLSLDRYRIYILYIYRYRIHMNICILYTILYSIYSRYRIHILQFHIKRIKQYVDFCDWLSFFKIYFIDYAITVVPFPLHYSPPPCTPPPTHPPPPFSSCPRVIHTSSLASIFPILFLTSPRLFCACHLCFFFLFLTFILRERGREGEREGEKQQCMIASRSPHTGDLAHNLGMCPDWESNRRPFASQSGAQSTEPHQPGLFGRFFKKC